MARKRRATRFGLRALFVVVTVLCIWIGFWASRARQQRLAVERIKGLNGSVTYDCRPDELRVPGWIRRFVGDDYFLTVECVYLGGATRGGWLGPAKLEAAVSAIKQLPTLGRLSLTDSGIRDGDLAILSPLSNQLEELSICEYSGFGYLTGSGLLHLRGWSRLKDLSMVSPCLNKSSVGRRASIMDHLVGIPNLKRLRIKGCTLDQADFTALQNCRQLQELTLWECRFTGQALAALGGGKRLEKIVLQNTGALYSSSTTDTPSAECIDAMAIRFQPFGFGREHKMSTKQIRAYKQWLDSILPGVDVNCFAVWSLSFTR